MNEAISKAKRCELCPPDEETCYCYDDKPSVYLTESQLDEIVKEFVKPAVSEDDRRLKMTVLSLVSDLRNCRAELAEERAAHNAHVTELCELEKENRKLRQERDAYYNNARYTEASLHEVTSLRSQLQSAQQEIERLEQDRDKLIEVLRKLAKTNAENISEIREWKAKQNDPEVTDLDWYNYVARDILKEIGVMMSE
jgi:chromosome segregation ATPase